MNPIILEKSGDKKNIVLSKDVSGGISKDEIVINLNWSQDNKEKEKGFFKRFFNNSSSDIDLDLGCFYELKDGQKSVIDGLQFSNGRGGSKSKLSNQGRYTGKPWIWHSGDDRAGSVSDGESIYLNPLGFADIKRIMIYCFIYEGVSNWTQTNAVVTIKTPGNSAIVVKMGHQTSAEKFCVLANLEFSGKDEVTIEKIVSFHMSHRKCDEAYNWGLTWTSGSK